MLGYIIIGILIICIIYYYLRCKTIYRFYSKTCGYCIDSQDEWDLFKSTMKDNYFIIIVDVDINDDSGKLADKYKINGVPQVLCKTYSKNHLYEGERTAVGYKTWIESL